MKHEASYSAWARGFGLALMLGLCWKTQGQGIIYTEPQPQPYYSLGYPGTLDFNLDINGDGITDFILESGSSDINYATLIPQGNNAIVSMNSFAAAMTNGETIGSSLAPIYQWSTGSTTVGYLVFLLGNSGVTENGNFVGKTSGYIGFNLANNGNNYYGWMYISSPSGGGLDGDAGTYGEVVNWAYQSSPNTAILAGAVPEPSTFALLALGGMAGIGFLRRKG